MPPRRRARTWVAFFAALGLLAAAAVGLETWYNLRQQLTPAALEQARSRWAARGPADYDLTYAVARQAPTGEPLRARRGGGTSPRVAADGVPLEPDLYAFHDLAPLFPELGGGEDGDGHDVTATAPDKATHTYRVRVRHGRPVRAWCDDGPVPTGMADGYAMDALLAGIGRLLERDRAAGGWPPYVVAVFDPADGHLLHYVHSRMRTRERVAVNLLEWKGVSGEGAAQAPRAP
jgi:hypothetical protein